jgi:hypothetical protein
MTNDRADFHGLDGSARTPDHVVFRTFANETVFLNLETGLYHGVNPTGGRMLEELVRSATLREAAARLSEQYGRPLSEIEQDLLEFCGDLQQRGLLELRPPDPV